MHIQNQSHISQLIGLWSQRQLITHCLWNGIVVVLQAIGFVMVCFRLALESVTAIHWFDTPLSVMVALVALK